MNRIISSDVMKKVFYFLLPAILTIIIVLSIIAVARAEETVGSPAREEMQTEEMVAVPAGEAIPEAAQEVVQKEMPGMEQSGTQADAGETAETEKPEPTAEK